MSITGIKNLDAIILNKLDDKDLVNICQTNKVIDGICKDQQFWLNRILTKFPYIPIEVLNKYKNFGNKNFNRSWSDYYIYDLRKVGDDVLLLNQELIEASEKGKLDHIIILHKRNIPKLYIKSYLEKDHPFNVMIKITNERNIRAMNNALITASKFGHLDIVKYLMDSGADIHANNDEALKHASENGYTDIVKLLINSGADIHANNDAALLLASYNGNLDIVKLLINSGANIHADDNAALVSASMKGHLDIIKLLINNGADIHSGNSEALRFAREKGHSDVVKYLLSLQK